MREIDERVLEMQFDNGQFERGVKTSLNTLDALKKGLNLESSVKSMSDLDRASKSLSMASLAQNVEYVSSKFSALGIVGITALQNISNSAINTGKRLVSALTIDPIKSGFSEYETKIGAIQTILTNTASKGTKLEDVNRVLGELNEYSDKTIYNFSEMTKNIGTFTAAGIDLETSAVAIKGIANLAAGSGSNSLQASTAMYQLSQALSTGTVKLMDWNSVVNAGMGGELFKQALIDTGKELGKTTPKMENFRDSLQEGWITSEVLTKTLEKFANDEALVKAATEVKTFTQLFDTMKESVQSGWAVSWENIIGDKNQSAEMLTSISDAFNALIGPSADARNNMLQFWNANGGRDAIIEGITNSFTALKDIIRPVTEAFREIFPPMTGAKLVFISKSFKNLTENFKIGADTTERIRETFKGLFAALDIVGQVISTVIKGFATLFGVVLPAGDGLLYLTSSLGNLLVSFNESIKSSGIFTTALEKLSEVVQPIPALFTKFDKIPDIFFNLMKAVGDVFSTLSKRISEGLNDFSFDNLFKVINSGLFATILYGVKKFVDNLSSIFENDGLIDNITGLLGGVKESLQAYQNDLKAGTLLKIAGAIGILSAALVALSLIDSDKLLGALAAMSVMFGELIFALGLLEVATKGMKLKSLFIMSTGLMTLSSAILILSFAMKNLGDLEWDEIAKGLVATGSLIAMLITSSKLLASSSGTIVKGAGSFIIFATSLLILGEAVEKIGSLDLAVITKGLIGVGILAAELVLFMKTADMSGMGIKSSIGILVLAGALKVLADAVRRFGEMDIQVLLTGLAGIAAMLGMVSLFVNSTGNVKHVISTAIGLTILGTALVIFSKAVENMGSLPLPVLAQGLGAMAASLTILAIAMKFLDKGLPGAAALMVMAGALAILAPVLKILGNMSLVEIAKSLVVLVGAFAVLGGAATLMTPMIPAIYGLAGAIALLGASVALIGGGILALSAGLTALAISGAAGTAAIVALVSGLAGTIPTILTAFGDGIVALAGVITRGAPAIMDAFASIFVAIAKAMKKAIPEVTDAILVFLDSMLRTIVEFVPKLVEGGMKLVLGILTGIRDHIKEVVMVAIDIVVQFIQGITEMIPKVIEAGFDLAISFINGLADALRGNKETLVSAIKNLILAMIEAGLQLLTGSTTLFKDAGVVIMNSGLIQGIKSKVKDVLETVKNIPTVCIEALKGFASGFFNAGKELVNGFIKGIGSKIGEVSAKAASMAQTALTSAKRKLGIESPSKEFIKVGMYTVLGFVEGLDKYKSKSDKAAEKVGTSAISVIKGTIGKVSEAAKALNLTPEIKPKVETSSVDKGLAAIQNKVLGLAATSNGAGKAIVALGGAAALYSSTSGDLLKEGLVEGFKNKVDDVEYTTEEVGTTCVDTLRSFAGDFEAVGEELIDSFINGLYNKSNQLVNHLKNIVQRADTESKQSINSQASSSFVSGLKTFTGVVASSTNDVKTKVVATLGSSILKISDALSKNLNTNPTIKPVLDLTNVESKLKSAFDKTFGLNVGTVEAKAASITRVGTAGIGGSNDTTTNTNTKNNVVINQYNTVRNDSDIKKISTDLKNMSTRYNNAKGVPVY